MKCFIWGTGSFSKEVFYKVEYKYEILGFVDNNSEMWNKKIFDKMIFSPEYFKKNKFENVDIIIASAYYYEIYNEICNNNYFDINRVYYIDTKSYLLKKFCDNKTNNKEKLIKRVLFVHYVHNTRTYKIATALSLNGIKVDFAYLKKHPFTIEKSKVPYSNIIPINDVDEFIDYVNNEDYDIIHSSNEPDCLTTLLLNTNKVVIHDTFDMNSLRGDVSLDDIISEYNANKNSHGNIYVTDLVKEIAIEKFHINSKKIFVLNNYLIREQKPKEYLKKLSSIDGEIHCVYEGGIISETNHHRYLEDIFYKICEKGIHIHFYSPWNNVEYYKKIESYSKYLHYEGCCEPGKLMTELTKYDIGLVELNITNRNRRFLETTFPNKIFEYINAKLPVAVCDIAILKKFVEKYNVGKYLDLDKDINEQIENILKIDIDENILEKNHLFMEDQAEELIKFYKKVKGYD